MAHFVAYIAVVVKADSEIEAADAISEEMREVTKEESFLLDWQHIEPDRPIEILNHYEYENWAVLPRMLEGF